MNLLVFRHAMADPYAPVGGRDSDRPLTRSGRNTFCRAVRVWRRLVPTPLAIVTSPFLRARQTAEILSQEFGELPIHMEPELEPDGSPEHILSRLPNEECLCLVSHMPLVGDFAGRLLAGDHHSALPFSTGQGIFMELAGPHAATAQLLVSMTTDAAARLEG